MRSISMPSLSHHTDTLLSPKSALGLAKGTPLSAGRDHTNRLLAKGPDKPGM
jgi:hypothetical protein